MFLFIFLALICVKMKGYKIVPILKAYALYPYILAEGLYVFLQMNVWLGNYDYIKYGSLFKNIYLLTLIIPLLLYKLYKPGFISAALIVLGTILNRFVISQNGGKMPVFASLSKITGYYNESVFGTIDNVHTIGNASTKFKFLTDFIDIGFSVLSIGDILIHAYPYIVICSVIGVITKSQNLSKTTRRDTLYGDV
ncbi:MAG: DUF5317 family protein [Anaerocolumna sp.]